MASVNALDVRVNRKSLISEKRLKAAKAAARFIRLQAEALNPPTKSVLVERIWSIYWTMYHSNLLVAPYSTRRLLRNKYGYWGKVGVENELMQ